MRKGPPGSIGSDDHLDRMSVSVVASPRNQYFKLNQPFKPQGCPLFLCGLSWTVVAHFFHHQRQPVSRIETCDAFRLCGEQVGIVVLCEDCRVSHAHMGPPVGLIVIADALITLTASA